MAPVLFVSNGKRQFIFLYGRIKTPKLCIEKKLKMYLYFLDLKPSQNFDLNAVTANLKNLNIEEEYELIQLVKVLHNWRASGKINSNEAWEAGFSHCFYFNKETFLVFHDPEGIGDGECYASYIPFALKYYPTFLKDLGFTLTKTESIYTSALGLIEGQQTFQ